MENLRGEKVIMKTVRTNELKKGTHIWLRNGWEATIMDNMKGNTRLAEVYGDYTEIGSVYAHDIVGAEVNGERVLIEYTDSQMKCKDWSDNLFAQMRGY